jgi:hypothetical protein
MGKRRNGRREIPAAVWLLQCGKTPAASKRKKKQSACQHRPIKPNESEAFYNPYVHVVVYVALKDKLEFCPSEIPAMDVRREAVYDFQMPQNGPKGSKSAHLRRLNELAKLFNDCYTPYKPRQTVCRGFATKIAADG